MVVQIIGGSVQVFWGMMRALQLVVLNSLINTPMPALTTLFMQILMNMAQYDFFDAQFIYKESFEFKETPAFSDNFDFFGFGDKNFLMNSGSFFPFVIMIAGEQIMVWVLSKVTVKLASCSVCRRVGTWLYKNKDEGTLLFPYQKLFLEVYFDLFLVTLLHFHSFIFDNDGNGLSAFF